MPKSKKRKNWGFSPTEGDRINRSRRNLARKRIPWVYYSTPHFALIGRRGSVHVSVCVVVGSDLPFLVPDGVHGAVCCSDSDPVHRR